MNVEKMVVVFIFILLMTMILMAVGDDIERREAVAKCSATHTPSECAAAIR